MCSSAWKLRLLVLVREGSRGGYYRQQGLDSLFQKKAPAFQSIHQQKPSSGGTTLSQDNPKPQLDLLLLFNVTAGKY